MEILAHRLGRQHRDRQALQEVVQRHLHGVRVGGVGPLDDRAKVAAVVAALDARRRHHDCCASGDYSPLGVVGTDASRVLAFARGEDLVAVVTRRPSLGPIESTTDLELPAGTWRVLLGANDAGELEGRVPVADVLDGWSAGLLERVR